ncbi:glycosyltransferase [Vulcanisaeta thermophila]|uniref:glycosyltransferase n=1 Tax=Vulcanisaeta thermophila TaxID=867917 RepID=UPI000852BABB|nr:glycosyltransferase family 2 protein [Vulcanisaeta thermophila]
MSAVNNEVLIKELIRELINRYIENSYPWGILTRPLTPMAMVILTVTYVLTLSMLILSTLQVITLTIYGVRSLRVLKGGRTGLRNVLISRSLPRVSVLVPIKGESVETIIMQLRNLSRLDYPRELMEIIFVSDDSEDYARTISRIIGDYAMKLGLNARLIHRPNHTGFKGAALNYGLRYAGGDVIMIIDVDTMLPRNYLRESVGMLMRGYDAVTATWKGYSIDDSAFSRITSFMYNVYNEFFIRGRFLMGGFPAISGNNIVIWKHILNELGGFCECTGEDLDLSIRLRSLGYRIGLINDDVYCEVPHDYQSFKLQFSRWLFNGVWNLKHNIKFVIRSKAMGVWEKIDAVLWMLQFPSMSFAALSVIMTMVMSAIGVLIPPLPLTILETAFIISTIAFFIIMLRISNHVGYGIRDTIMYSVRTALVMLVMSFPMLINTMESLVSDEYQWVVTPKGPMRRLNYGVRYILSELVVLSLVVMLTIVSIVYRNILLLIYSTVILILMIHGIRLIIPNRRVKYR